jgi:prolyl 4-hydroxylase
MDADSQFRLGMSLLADPGPAEDWRRAVELLETAAAGGHGEAAERCALFEFMGVGRPADLPKALNWLARAAQLGSQSAARQLVVLADNRFVTAEEAQTGTSWSDLASRVAIDRRLRPPLGRDWSGKPLIRAFEDFASPAECEWLIDRAARRLAPASVRDPNTGQAIADPVRNNRSAVFDFADLDLIVEMIRVRLALAIGAAPPFLEASQVLHYSVGQEFKPHHDYLDPTSALAAEIARNGQRAATELIYHNEYFDGGESGFDAIKID